MQHLVRDLSLDALLGQIVAGDVHGKLVPRRIGDVVLGPSVFQWCGPGGWGGGDTAAEGTAPRLSYRVASLAAHSRTPHLAHRALVPRLEDDLVNIDALRVAVCHLEYVRVLCDVGSVTVTMTDVNPGFWEATLYMRKGRQR